MRTDATATRKQRMGLDAVEFVLAVEDAFGIAIPDADAEQMITPRAVADYVAARLPRGDHKACHSQQAFYRVRRAVVQAHGIPRDAVTPSAEWQDLLGKESFRQKWQRLGKVVGLSEWPKPSLFGYVPPACRTVGATAEYMARRAPSFVKGAGAEWTREEIEAVISNLMKDELAITSFDWDDRFGVIVRSCGSAVDGMKKAAYPSA
jgi:hypothetical protein